MKSIIFLYASELSSYAYEPLPNKKSALESCFESSLKLLNIEKIVFLADNSFELPQSIENFDNYKIIKNKNWNVSLLFKTMAENSKDFNSVYFSWADCPYLDANLSNLIIEEHNKYAAEYSFAEGYPYGLTVDVLYAGIMPILEKLAENDSTEISRNVIFDLIQKDINSYDIETYLAPEDLRHLRLSFSCDTKRNFLLCKRLNKINGENYGSYILENEVLLKTLPAYYSIQISGKCPHECIFCPYPEHCKNSIGETALNRNDFMSFENFKNIVEKIESFSDDAVISLSLWGEPAFHPEITKIIDEILSKTSLSVLIETTGIGWKQEDLEKIAKIVKSSKKRKNNNLPIHWIVSLDAISSNCYKELHQASEDDFREALSTTENLMKLFPKMVWTQCIRMNENEEELEAFYRFWKEKNEQVIVQKHDHFCKTIPDRRVADLSPLIRRPCWHLKRDINILIDGTIPLCREDLSAKYKIGNILNSNLEEIWENFTKFYEQHCKKEYEGICINCDEYYTFNF